MVPDLNTFGVSAGRYHAGPGASESIDFSLPWAYAELLSQTHRVPAELGDFDLAELATFEPCIGRGAAFGLRDLIIHELTHALSRGDEVIGEDSSLLPALRRLYPKGPIPTSLDRIGVAFAPTLDCLNED